LKAAYLGILEHQAPVYLRFSRTLKEELYSPDDYKFQIGKAITLLDGHDVTIIATGTSVHIAKKVAEETKRIVTVEDTNAFGSLGTAVARIVCQNNPVKVKNVSFPDDSFSVIGPSINALNEYFEITVENVVKKAERIFA